MAYGLCEKGEHRAENQDAILICQNGKSGLFIVADGVGGSDDGANASSCIIEEYQQWWDQFFLPHKKEAFPELFDSAKQQAGLINQKLCAQAGPGKSCSTMVLLFLHKGMCGWLSCGDSRIYRYSRNKARQITRDDTWENHPGGSVNSVHVGKIMSAVGGYEQLEYSSATDRISFGEAFLLCSDGIYKFVAGKSIMYSLSVIGKALAFRKDLAKRLADEAVQNDTTDNYSLIAVKV